MKRVRFANHWKVYALPWMFLAMACSRGDDGETAQKTAALEKKAGFPGKVLLAALDDVDLRDDQRAEVVRLMEQTRALLAPLRRERAQLLRDAAASVRAGAVDGPAIKDRVQQMKGTFDQAKPALIRNLDQLHALLDRDQRRQLVDALHQRTKEHLRAHGLGPGAGPGAGPGPGEHGGPHRFLGRLAAKLGLTVHQQADIRDRLREKLPHHPEGARRHHQAMRERMRAAAEAFVADDFEAADLEIWSHHEHRKGKLDKIIGVSRVVLPILSVEQRARIASRLEHRSAALEK